MLKKEDTEFILTVKMNKIVFNEDVEIEIRKFLEDKISVENAATLYFISQQFQLSTLSDVLFAFMERSFTMFAGTCNFLELDFTSVAKILSSGELHIDSELQVFNAATKWLCHNVNERSKYAKDILLKTRFHLLSGHALKYLLNITSTFYTNENFAANVKEVLQNKKLSNKNKSTTYLKSRYCHQKSFKIIACGGKSINFEHVDIHGYSIEAYNFNKLEILPKMNTPRQFFNIVCVKGEVYALGGKTSTSVEKYSPASRGWEKVAEMYDYRKFFGACSFIDNVYVMGGYDAQLDASTESCLEFNTEGREWREISRMKHARCQSSCAAFEGRIIVSGRFIYSTY